MGTLVSAIREIVYLGFLTVKEISETSSLLKEVLERISSPTLPVVSPSIPIWHVNPTFPYLVNIRSDRLPPDADIVIIGSGLSGASLAYTILTECQSLGMENKVVILEARQICSGATGRNGGHLKCAPYAEYCKWKRRFGMKTACELLRFQMEHLPIILDLVKREGLTEAEAREVETVDIFTDEESWVNAKDMVKELSRDLPNVAQGIIIWEGPEARQKFSVGNHCCGALTYTAGALWPYRLVTSIYDLLLRRYPSGLSIETNTTAETIEVNLDDQARPFMIRTSRGYISTRHVIHATDSFAPNLIPGLKSRLFPIRGHMTAQRPGTAFPELNGSRSWSLVGKKGFDYITQRPGKVDDELAGAIMVGGGIVQSENKGMDELGIWSDSQASPAITAYLGGILPVAFGPENWGGDKSPSRMIQSWTGCMGYTMDLLPYVGWLDGTLTGRPLKVPKLSEPGHLAPAEWISAGFNGQGMVSAWLSGAAVGLMVLGRENVESKDACGRPDGKVDEWFPEILRCSKKRIDRASIVEFSKWI